MDTITNTHTEELALLLGISNDSATPSMQLLSEADAPYLRDLKMNFKSVLKSDYLSEKEIALLGVAIAANEKNRVLLNFFKESAKSLEAGAEEIAEAVACASLLSSNNVYYRFKHFVKNEKYQQLAARTRMNIMMKPVLGKEFFELISLAVSAVNGCQACVNAHENSLIEMGSSENRIHDAVRLAAILTSVGKIFYQ